MALSCCTARSKSSSKTVVDDSHHHVYPVHALDQSTESQPLLTWVMCFNDVLHAQKLQTSLCQLLEIGDWKKLACRLRVTVGRGHFYCHGGSIGSADTFRMMAH